MNILFFFSNTKVGGAETNILKISTELAKMGHVIHFAALENNGPLLDYPHSAESFTDIGKYEKSPLASFRKYKELLLKKNIEVVSAFGLRVDLFTRVFSKRINKKVRIISNIRASESWRKPIHSYLDKITSGNVDLWVSNSFSAAKTFIDREKLDPGKIRVIYNFIEFEKRPVLLNDLDFMRIGVLANYKAVKGHFNLLPVSKMLIDKNVNFKFICAGHDYTNGQLQESITNAGLGDYIELVGHIGNKTKFFEDIDMLFLPSYIEGLPTSIIEGMAEGVPVISSNVDGTPEVVSHGHNGFITDPDDLAGFVDYIIAMKPPEVRRQFIERSYNVLLEKFHKRKQMELWSGAFNDVML